MASHIHPGDGRFDASDIQRQVFEEDGVWFNTDIFQFGILLHHTGQRVAAIGAHIDDGSPVVDVLCEARKESVIPTMLLLINRQHVVGWERDRKFAVRMLDRNAKPFLSLPHISRN
jgi:hypothetical protein